jgi:hypothetical protein
MNAEIRVFQIAFSLQVVRIPLHPEQNGGMREAQSAFRHHLNQIAEAELVAQILAHAQDDHFAVKVSPSKQLLDAVQFAHR